MNNIRAKKAAITPDQIGAAPEGLGPEKRRMPASRAGPTRTGAARGIEGRQTLGLDAGGFGRAAGGAETACRAACRGSTVRCPWAGARGRLRSGAGVAPDPA